MTYRPRQNIADINIGPISITLPNMNQIHQIFKKKYKLLKHFNVNVDADANANAGGSALALLDFFQAS